MASAQSASRAAATAASKKPAPGSAALPHRQTECSAADRSTAASRHAAGTTSSFQSPAYRSPVPHIPLVLEATGRPAPAPPRERSASPAAFPPPAGPHLPAHSSQAVRFRVPVPAAPARGAETAQAVAQARGSAAAEAASHRDLRPYSLAPGEPVDLKGVPGRSCRWIPMCSGGVSSVVSSSAAHLFLYRE